MIAVRSSSLKRAQPAISGSVRRHPRQKPDFPSTAQTFTQGVTMGRGGRGVGGAVSEIMRQISSLAAMHARGALCIGPALA